MRVVREIILPRYGPRAPTVPIPKGKAVIKIAWNAFEKWFTDAGKAVGKRLCWSDQKSKQVAHETFKALFAKSICEQTLACSLPPEMDQVWHELILNTYEYDQYCRHVFGRFLHHTTSTVDDPVEEKQKRVDLTRAICFTICDDVQKWEMETKLVEQKAPRRSSRISKKKRERPVYKEEVVPSEIYHFFLKEWNGTTVCYFFSPSMTIGDAKRMHWFMGGVDSNSQRFIYAGRQLEDDKTFGDYHLTDNCTIHLIRRLRGC